MPQLFSVRGDYRFLTLGSGEKKIVLKHSFQTIFLACSKLKKYCFHIVLGQRPY